ncbi:MetQ/NlpA family ABC transporter substrate-binding protein [Tardiphaga sp. 20_F10_N6_6]|jgi:hypothetical protein|uniref:MetQ/NlpA family ABC transporter substrate-binding protein n=1 Tax=Tardiphaga sp. 20_F10_N6_6 TaxID=3240788 RepID=UPI003F8C4BF0
MIKPLLRIARAAGLLAALTGAASADQPLKIATSAGPVGQLVSFAASLAKDKGLDVKVVELTDWIVINESVQSGDTDANLFQHSTYLAIQNKQRGFTLAQVDKVGVIAPVGLFSKKVKSLSEIKSGDSVAIPNEPLNGARGLILLERAGLLKLAPGNAYSPAFVRYLGTLAQDIYDTYGKFPGTQPSVGVAAYTQAHHIDLGFYDTHYKDGAYLQTHADHQRVWHGVDKTPDDK